MQTTLSTSIDPIEVAFLRKGLATALDVAAVRAVELGALTLEGRRLRVADAARAQAALPGEPLTAALIAAAANAPSWREARIQAQQQLGTAGTSLERLLVAAGLLRERTPWRWLAGRRTARGSAWLQTAQLAYPAAQIVNLDPALALALHGARALDGTRYHGATVAKQGFAGAAGDGGGCGASFAGDGGHGGHGCGSGGGHGCGSGGCGGGCGSGS